MNRLPGIEPVWGSTLRHEETAAVFFPAKANGFGDIAVVGGASGQAVVKITTLLLSTSPNKEKHNSAASWMFMKNRSGWGFSFSHLTLPFTG